ncbi:MAG: tRNA (uracil-5-)-methyltransferase [Candidatus Limivicinus sp.]|nr:tRNA (uracil-5-)-methyltransferase [Candidatus Limivicinus sp.]
MDPPRAGSDERFLSSLLKCAPKRIVYISCNIDTQRRDLDVLLSGGYKLRHIQPVDMFPYTEHIECVVMLSLL